MIELKLQRLLQWMANSTFKLALILEDLIIDLINKALLKLLIRSCSFARTGDISELVTRILSGIDII